MNFKVKNILLHIPLNVQHTAHDMQCAHDVTCGTSHTVCTSLSVVTAWHHFTETAHLWWFSVAFNNALYIGLHIKCLIFSPDINQISVISTGFHSSSQCQIPHKTVQWKPSWCMWTDRLTAWYHFNWKEHFCGSFNIVANTTTYFGHHVNCIL